MGLSIGIVGLPNVGKSTTFNALTKAQNAEVASYPFCTIQPNRAIVPVPDPRLEALQAQTGRPQAIHATIEFVDIAGLVEGASRGEGLGNQFLAHIREVDLIVHIVRCFEDLNVPHVSDTLDPVHDIEVVNLELVLADLQQLDRKIERLEGQAKGDRRTYQPLLDAARALREHLDRGAPARNFEGEHREAFQALNREMRFLTAKSVIYVANVDEDGLGQTLPCETAVRGIAESLGADFVKLCARLEEALIDLDERERREMLALAGAEESGLEQVIRLGYERLGLISFFSMNENEVRAWTVRKGTRAPEAAGVIHTDFERGFIKAEVVSYPVFMHHGSLAAVRAAGQLRIEGKDYVVQDGDLIYFRLNV